MFRFVERNFEALWIQGVAGAGNAKFRLPFLPEARHARRLRRRVLKELYKAIVVPQI